MAEFVAVSNTEFPNLNFPPVQKKRTYLGSCVNRAYGSGKWNLLHK